MRTERVLKGYTSKHVKMCWESEEKPKGMAHGRYLEKD